MRETIARLIDWFRRDRLDAELREELQFHQQQLQRDASAGMAVNPRGTAHRMGNVMAIRESARERWSIPWMDNLQQDVRYALRGIRRNPGFTAVVVITLALGFGANAAVFSLIDRLFAHPPTGLTEPGSLRRIYLRYENDPGKTQFTDLFNYPQFSDIHAALGDTPSATYAIDSLPMERGENSRYVIAAFTDAGYWKTLGAPLIHGRSYNADEARIEVPGTVAIISYRLWQREFSGRADVVGQTVQLRGKRYDVIGVAGKDFEGLDLGTTDIWLPLGAMPMTEWKAGQYWYQIRSTPRLRTVVRLLPATNVAALTAKLGAAYRIGSIAYGYKGDSSATVQAGSIIAARGPLDAVKEQLIASRLAWVSIFVLLIACANVANLLLTRLAERQREVAVRLALGVSHRRIAQQFFVELLLLATLSLIAAGIVGDVAGTYLRRALVPEAHWTGPAINLSIIAGMACAALVVVAGIALALVSNVRRFGSVDALKSGQRATSHGHGRLRATLVVSQTAFAVVLLSGALLSVESLRRVLSVKLGYDIDQVAYAIPIPRSERGAEAFFRGKETGRALQQVADRLAQEPVVRGAALSAHAPVGGYSMMGVYLYGDTVEPKVNGKGPTVRSVSPEYWSVVGLDLIRGRVFSKSDVTGAPLAVVINEFMAQTIAPRGDALGKCLTFHATQTCRTVVGIVRDAHFMSVVEDRSLQVYLPLAQAGQVGDAQSPSVIVFRASPGELGLAMMKARQLLDAAIPGADLRMKSLAQRIEPDYRPWRLGALLFGVLATLGLVVASIGLYGTIAYGVRRRTHELGVRAALGAERSRLVGMVLKGGVRTVATGSVLGVTISIALSRYASSLMYETSVASPLVLSSIVVVMLLTAVLASLVPAWQAGRISPMTALRGE